MTTTINNYYFKFDNRRLVIEVYRGSEASDLYALINVDHTLSEKEFHIEVSDWYLKNNSVY